MKTDYTLNISDCLVLLYVGQTWTIQIGISLTLFFKLVFFYFPNISTSQSFLARFLSCISLPLFKIFIFIIYKILSTFHKSTQKK